MCKFLTAGFFAFCLSGLSLYGSGPQPQATDAEISRKLLHTWIAHAVWIPAEIPNHLDGTVAFTPDGKFVTKGVFTIVNDKRPFDYKGAWQVKDGFLVEIVTESSLPKTFRLGGVSRDKVIRVDDKELVYQTEGGKIVTRTRKADL